LVAPEKHAAQKQGPAGAKSGGGKAISFAALMARKNWKPLPAIAVLTGSADFFKSSVVKRFGRELFGDKKPELQRFQGPTNERLLGELPLATVLDEVRTPSFFSPYRLVVVDHANLFVGEHGQDLLPFLETGFSGGYLILHIDGKLDGRTRFAKLAAEKGWVIECAQPYDRPPPWETRVPAWDSELTRWLVDHARTKGLQIAPQTAFLLHEKAGTDLSILDEELEKIATYLSSRGSKMVDEGAIGAVVGDLRQDSVFSALDLFLEGKQAEALEAIDRLFKKGYHTEKGALTVEPTSIALLFTGALIPRLRSLRRAHALAAEGAGPDQWLEAGLVQRPFLGRFQRQLKAVSPAKIERLFERLYRIDKSIKTGGDAENLIHLLVAELGSAAP
jgi:DNA polymerase III delta subunit